MFVAVIFMLVAMVSITAGASLAKTIFPIIGAEITTALRLGFAAVMLSIVFCPWRHLPNKNQLRLLVFYGASLGLMNMIFYLSIARIPLGIALALEFTGPLAVALYATRHWQDVIWVAFAVAGIVLLLPFTEVSAHLDAEGIWLALLAGVFWAIYIVIGKRVAESRKENNMRGGVTVAWGMMVAALVATPLGVMASGGEGVLSQNILIIALGVALLSSAIPYSLEMAALKALPTKTFGILTSMEPAVGALAGFLFLSERLTWLQMLAIGCIITASIGSTYFENRRKAQQLAN
jgi:inner membrane transporter RhtA